MKRVYRNKFVNFIGFPLLFLWASLGVLSLVFFLSWAIFDNDMGDGFFRRLIGIPSPEQVAKQKAVETQKREDELWSRLDDYKWSLVRTNTERAWADAVRTNPWAVRTQDITGLVFGQKTGAGK
jgi:hypothetical protein